MARKLTLFLVIYSSHSVLAGLLDDFTVKLENDGPVVQGGTVNFVAAVYVGDKLSDYNKFKYFWDDDAIPNHRNQSGLQNSTYSWTITYPRDTALGIYIVRVTVEKCMASIFCYTIGSVGTIVKVTDTLNGGMVIRQDNRTRENNVVANDKPFELGVFLKKSDSDVIAKAPTVLTYWFIDCTYYGITNDLTLPYNFSAPEQSHVVEALVMADFTPLPPPTTVAPSTTTTTPTTTKATSTTTKPTTPTTGPFNKTVSQKSIIKRSISNTKVKTNGTLLPHNVSFPYVCNSSFIATDPNKTFGYFSKKIDVKVPVSKINVTGNNWLQHGELLSLRVRCAGSQALKYCVKYKSGLYNVTGNETCEDYKELDVCDFPISHYISRSMHYTVIIILQNDVNKIVTPVAITVYEVKTQAQLSVIVVPVAFSLVAVVIIIFGVAYYFQNRTRFIVEVADFNFGQQYADMEYKTFRERLWDSIMNAFSRAPSRSSSEVPVWPPGRKYGSMT